MNFAYWYDKCKEAEAERDEARDRFVELLARAHAAEHNFGVEHDRAEEALAKAKEQKLWSGRYRDSMWAEHDRAEEALAQVAVLAKECLRDAGDPKGFNWVCIPCAQRGPSRDAISHWKDCPLSNLPAAVKEMLAERDRLDAGWHEANQTALELGLERDRLREALEELKVGEGDDRCWCGWFVNQSHPHADPCQKAQAALSDQKPTDAKSESR